MTCALSHGERVELFTYETAFMIARKKRPYTEAEDIVKPAIGNFIDIFEGEQFQEKLMSTLGSIPLSDNTMSRRLELVAADISAQIMEDLSSSPYFTIALDESTDVAKNAQLLLYARFEAGLEMKDELLAVLTLETTCSGEDIYNAVKEFLIENGLDLDKLVECNVDGCNTMMGRIRGFRGRMLNDHPHVNFVH